MMSIEDWRLLQQIRVRYSETDAMGFAYYGHAAAWFEIARTELIRQSGISYAQIEGDHGLWLPVLHLEVTYHKAAHYDDLLQLKARWGKVGRARFSIAYRVLHEEQLLLSGETEHCLLNAKTGKPVALPPWFFDLMEPKS